MNLVIGFIYATIAQVITFLQIQGNIKYQWYNKYPLITLSASIPIAWLYIKSVEYFTQHFKGQIWPSRFIGFSIGMIVFSILSSLMFNESLTMKTIICILLSVSILLVQLFWK